MKKRVLYANANYEEVVGENGYFLDKLLYKLIIMFNTDMLNNLLIY